MSFLLAVDPNKTLKFSDALSYGAQTVLLGMATVFAVLITIWLALLALKFFLHDLPAKKSAENVPAPMPVVAQEPTKAPKEDEIIAVIAAAIAAAESESDGIKFRVVSFRRK